MFYRTYTGDDGETHFEPIDAPTGPVKIDPNATISITRWEPGHFVELHPAPRRQFHITSRVWASLFPPMAHGSSSARRRKHGGGPDGQGPHHGGYWRRTPRLHLHTPSLMLGRSYSGKE